MTPDPEPDEFLPFAAEFARPPGVIYLDGNSLGLLCRPAEDALRQALDAWRGLAVEGWTRGDTPWYTLARRVAALLAPLVGAEPGDLALGQSTTVNLQQLLATFYDPADHPALALDALAFPSDRYAVDSHLRLRGRDPARDLVVLPSPDGLTLDEDALAAAVPESVGLAVLPAVVFTSGQLLDMPRLTRRLRDRGVLVAWDCSHSAGAVPHRFRDDDIDLAFGCTYKYLNGGPGSVAFLYVHPRLCDRRPGMAGWFGCDPGRQFDMAPEFQPAADAGRFLVGTPHVLSLAPLQGSLTLLARVGLTRLRARSLALTALLRRLVETRLAGHGVRVVTPAEDHRRGGHIALAHPQAGGLARALRRRGVVPDFRPPDLLRLAPAPIYTSFTDCRRAVDTLADLLSTRAYEEDAGRDLVP